MGLLSKLTGGLVRLPRLRGDGRTAYRAVINTEGHRPHTFVFHDSRDLEEPVVIYNEHRFQMPLDPAFVEEETNGVRFRGRIIPLREIVPTFEDLPPDSPDRVEIPDEFKGKMIPEVNPSRGTVEQFAAKK